MKNTKYGLKTKDVNRAIPKFVNKMYDNWSSILQVKGMEENLSNQNLFKYKKGNEEITTYGLMFELFNPFSGKPFSVIISDDVISTSEWKQRTKDGAIFNGDLTMIGEAIEKRKSKVSNSKTK